MEEIVKTESDALKIFLESEENRKGAEEQAVQLWTILTGNKPIETSDDIEFTEMQVVKKTTLSHSKANNLFQLLRAFGFFEWTDMKKRGFKLHFNKEKCYEVIRTEIISVAKVINSDIARYKAAINADDTITSEDKETRLARLKTDVLGVLKF